MTATGRTQPSARPTTPGRLAARLAVFQGWVASHRKQALAAGGAALVLLVCVGVLATRRGNPDGPTEVKTAKDTPLDLGRSPVAPAPNPTPEPAPPPPIVVPGPVSTEPAVLLLTVKPWGAVYVDGKRVRREHVGTHEYVLTPGKHTLSIRGPRTSDFELEVQPGEHSSRVVELR